MTNHLDPSPQSSPKIANVRSAEPDFAPSRPFSRPASTGIESLLSFYTMNSGASKAFKEQLLEAAASPGAGMHADFQKSRKLC